MLAEGHTAGGHRGHECSLILSHVRYTVRQSLPYCLPRDYNMEWWTLRLTWALVLFWIHKENRKIASAVEFSSSVVWADAVRGQRILKWRGQEGWQESGVVGGGGGGGGGEGGTTAEMVQWSSPALLRNRETTPLWGAATALLSGCPHSLQQECFAV